VASDAELIGWSLAGDQETFVEVVSRHEAAVGAYLVRRVGRGTAEDLLGEVWTAAYTSRGSYDRSFPDARPWLFGIAHHTLSRHWRSRPAEDPHADLDSLSPKVDPWTFVDEQIDGRAALRDALAHLGAKQREILTLTVWEELSIAEAARVLGIPSGTARYLLHQARVTLRNDPGMVALMHECNHVKETR
jgi:RNA polymerase sigma factor (sigma-70 family)